MQNNFRDLETGIVHAPTWGGNDYTLCGNGMEGEHTCEIGEVVETHDDIDCEFCIAIILHCRALRLPTQHTPDVAKAAAQKGVLHKNRSGKRAGVA